MVTFVAAAPRGLVWVRGSCQTCCGVHYTDPYCKFYCERTLGFSGQTVGSGLRHFYLPKAGNNFAKSLLV